MSDYKEQAIYRQYLQKKNEDVAAPREIKYKQQVSLNKIHSDPRLSNQSVFVLNDVKLSSRL